MTDLWIHLKGNENGNASVFNIKVFLSAIMNFNDSWMKAPEAPEDAQEQNEEGQKNKKKVNPNALGTFSDSHIQLTDEEISWIAKHFVLMQYAR